jgi:PPM family protein phosphatase
MTGKMDVFGQTDIGRVRQNNEDQYLIADLNKSMRVHRTSLDLEDQTRLFGASQGHLLVVADGMGGHAAGEHASRLAVGALTTYVLNTLPWFFRLRQDEEEHCAEDLKAALQYCRTQIRAEAERVPERRGMGTTLTLAYLLWPRLFVVHAGDSRCYLLRQGQLWRITRDHTLAQQLADQGVLKDPDHSRWSHVLWNVVGDSNDKLAPEVYRADLTLGDTLLLCSDGLSKHVSDAEIAKILAAEGTSEEKCHQLVTAANEAGGTDNITVVVARFVETPQHARATAAAQQADTADEMAGLVVHAPPAAPSPAAV